MTPFDRFIAALEAKDCKGKGKDWQCPAHEDRAPSLTVTEGEDGIVLVTCHRGCELAAIVAAVGMEKKDLFPCDDTKKKAKKPRIIATYPYQDESSQLLYEVVRFDPKGFRQRRPDPTAKDGWTWKLDGVRRVPFRLPAVLAAIRTRLPVYLVEGEKDVFSLVAAGFEATCNAGGADPGNGSKFSASFARFFAGAEVRIIPDNDETGRKHTRHVAKVLSGTAASVKVVTLDRPGVKDASDFFERGGTADELRELVAATPEWCPIADETGAELLDAVRNHIKRYVVLGPHEATVIALWVLHTWTSEASDVTCYLAVLSAEKQSGKTKLIEVLYFIVRNPWRIVSPSEAVLFRKIHAAEGRITILFDEVDTVFAARVSEAQEGIRAILNAGFQRGETVPRCLDHGKSVEDFEVYCPKLLAGIGGLPDTVWDRSVKIAMRRKKKTDKVERFRLRDGSTIGRQLAERAEVWASASRIAQLRKARPDLPEKLGDRAQDAAESLLAIADMAGGYWPVEARKAIVALAGERDEVDESRGVQLLADIRRVLDTLRRLDGDGYISTAELIRELLQLPESTWTRHVHGKDPIDGTSLSAILRPFDIKPRKYRDGVGTPRGYHIPELRDTFERYLSEGAAEGEVDPSPPQPGTLEQPAARAALDVPPTPEHTPEHSRERHDVPPHAAGAPAPGPDSVPPPVPPHPERLAPLPVRSVPPFHPVPAGSQAPILDAARRKVAV